jgi:multidrug efflux pump subunit AcrA (membrane-fusion protein)
METEVDLANPDYAIKPGMFGSATLVLERRLDALSIPVQALSGRATPVRVLVVGAGKRLEERQVTLGLETPDRIEVLSGLREHDLVVVGSRGNLQPGLLVDPKPQATTPGGRTR